MTCTSSYSSAGSESRLCFSIALWITAGVLSWLVNWKANERVCKAFNFVFPGRVFLTFFFLLSCAFPGEMAQRNERGPGASPPGFQSRLYPQRTGHQLSPLAPLAEPPCLPPFKQERQPRVPCHFQRRLQWKNVYEGIVGNTQCFQSWAKVTLTCWALVTTCGLEMATVPYTDHCKKHKWLHNPGSPPLDIYQEEWKSVSTKGLLYKLSQQI